MKIKRILSILIVFLLLFTIFTPSMAFAENSKITNINNNFIHNTIESNINNTRSNNTFTITYHSGNGTFENGNTENTVVYETIPLTELYSYTPNLDSNGNSLYPNSELQGAVGNSVYSNNDIITIENAVSLEIDVFYGTRRQYNSNSVLSHLAIYKAGITPTASNYRSAYKYLTSSTDRAIERETFIMPGNTAQFFYYSRSGEKYSEYGYYAVIKGIDENNNYIGVNTKNIVQSGNYEEPTAAINYYNANIPLNFLGWKELNSDTIITDVSVYSEDVDLYAVFEDINTNILYSGTSGGCTWELFSDGTLIIRPTNGTSGTLANISKAANVPWYSYRTSIKKVIVSEGVSTNIYAKFLFESHVNLEYADLHNLNTTNTEEIDSLFSYCSKLKSINVSTWNTSNMTRLMLNIPNDAKVETLDLTNWNTLNCTYFSLGASLNLKLITVGQNFKAILWRSIPDQYWKNTETNNIYTNDELQSIYTQSMAGTYERVPVAQLYTDGTLILKKNSDIISGHGTVRKIYYDYGYAGFGWGDQEGHLNSKIYNIIILENITLTDDMVKRIDTDDGQGSNFEPFHIFTGLSKLKSISGIEKLNTSNLTTFIRFFKDCQSLTTIDVSNFDTSNATIMSEMFSGCKALTALDVSNFNTSNVTNMNSMFYECRALTTLDVSNWNTSNVTYMSSMFNGCRSLTSLDVSTWNIQNVTNMSSMFNYCQSLTTIDVSNWNTQNVKDMYQIFSSCSALTTLDVSNWNTQNVIDMRRMFYNCNKLITLDVSNWNTSNVINMSEMFISCSSLTSLDVSNFNTTKVTNMTNMFSGCQALTALDVSNWNTSNVTNMSYMFYNCSSLTALDLNNWNTSNVTNMNSMFYECRALTTLDLSNFNTFNVTNMGSMFANCSSLTSLDISNFDTSNVTNMAGIHILGDIPDTMFSNCNNLSLIILSENFKFSGKNITDTDYMSILPTPDENSTTGKWIREDEVYGPYTPVELRDIYDTNPEEYAGTWIWQELPAYTIILDTMGGYLESNTITGYLNKNIVFPTPIYPNYYFLGWNTEQDGSGIMYLVDSEYEYTNIAEPGETITLYAQWHQEIYYTYNIEIYEEKAEVVGEYTLVSSTQERIMDLFADEPITIVPTQNITGGFITPDSQIVTISPNNDTVIKFYYNRIRYNLAFNGNGNELANYPTFENVAANYGVTLPGSDLVETTPFIWRDTRNREYTPGQLFYYNPLQNGETITLYAVWNTTHDESTSQEGEVEIKIHAGDIINFPSLPAGTRYEIEEINLPDGWSMVDGYNLTGTISPNVNIRAEIINVYYANTEATLVVYKNLIGKQLEADMFSFDLVQYTRPIDDNPFSGRERYIDSAMNGIPYINPDDINNPFYGMGAIIFNIPLEQEGTYYYGIRENIGHDNTIVYDENESHITVTVTDNGDGTMSVDANYDKLVFTNRMADTMLPIIKTVSGGSSNAIFTFKVELYESGTSDELVPLTEEYTVLYADGRTSTVSHNGTIELRGGESCIIRGLPYMSKYKISEINTAGYSLIGSTNTSGTSEIFDTIDEDGYTFDERYAVKFENAYSSSGSIVLSATKQLIGRELEADKYQFELKDISGTVIQTTYAQADGSIEFAPIYYGLSDNGSVYTYFISEVVGEDEDILYDQNVISVFVVVNDNGAGTMIAEATYEQEPIFTNKVLIPITIKNNVYGKYNNENFHYTVEFSNTTLGVIYYTLNDSEEKQMVVIKDGKFEFDLKKDETITIYNIYAGTTIEVTQNEYENFSTSVNNEPGYTYIIESLVNSENINYLNANDIALPNTGSNMSIIIMSIGGLFIICGMTFIMIRKKKITVN